MTLESREKVVSHLSNAGLSRREFLRMAGLAGLSLGAVGALAGAAQAAALAPNEAPALSPSPVAEPVTLKMWWWGEEQVPGLKKWLEETVSKYSAIKPDITIETVQQSVDALIPSFEAAAAAKQGPDIALVWPGIWGLPYVWKGDILPLDDYLPADVLSHDPELIANSYGGKRYFLTWWWDANLLAYNKELFAKAGLDPEKPPVAWDKFLDACEKLKGIGVTPMVLGFKDLWDAEVLYTPMIYQNCDTPAQVLDVSCGNVSFTDPKFLEMWDRTAELNAKGYFNADILSLETYSADEPFVMGKAAMRPRAITSNVVSWAQQMGKDKVGTMQFPTFGKGKLVTKGVGAWWPETLCIPSFAAHPREAADFLAFFYTKERVNALHKQTGTVPGALDLFDASLVENPEVKKVIDWGYFTHYELLLNSTVDLEGVCKSLSDLVSGTVTPLEAAKFVDGVMARWKEQKPDEYKHVLEWGKDIARLG